jgi:hypothetical protein
VRPPRDRQDLLPWSSTDWTPRDETLVLRRAGTLRGVVRDRAGAPVPGIGVSYRTPADPENMWRGTSTGEDGRFEITGLPEGTVDLWPTVPSPFPSGQRPEDAVVHTDTAAAEPVLTVDAGVALLVRVEGWEAGPASPLATLRVERGGRQASLHGHVGPLGRVRFLGLAPGDRCTLWIGDREGGWYVLAEGLAPRPGEAVVRMQTGGTITGRVTLPDGSAASAAYVRVHVLDAFGPGTGADAAGRFRLPGVPPGRWRVGASISKDGQRYEGTTEASPGDEVEVRLQPVR